MIDRGLLLSIVVASALPWLITRVLPASKERWRAPGDPLITSGVIGLVGGRVFALLLDDPRSLGRLRDVMVIRGGVEFWAGLAIGALAFVFLTRREAVSVETRLSAAAPLFLLGYAGYEAMCIARDGCFGPPAAVGLVPVGFATRFFPIGWGVALATACTGLVMLVRKPQPHHAYLALLCLALARSIAGFHLPRLDDALTRPHLESLGLVVLAAAILLGKGAWTRHTTLSRTIAERPGATMKPDTLPLEGPMNQGEPLPDGMEQPPGEPAPRPG